jgi:hypothetical protein
MQIQFQIPDIYKGLYDVATVQTHLQAELNFYLVEQFGRLLKNVISVEELHQIGTEAKAKAWESYQNRFLEGLNVQ